MKKIVLLSAIIVVSFAACKKEDTKTTIQAQTFVINSTGSTVWKYFSFAKNDTVSVADPATSTAWDLAFQRYRIRTNGGIIGKWIGQRSKFLSERADRI